MSKSRLLAITATGTLLGAIAVSVCGAQTESDSTRSERHGKAEASLAKAAQNPVANMISLPLQYNFYTAGGLGSTSMMVLNLQPLVPLAIGKDWLIVSRTVVPFTSTPLPDVGILGRSQLDPPRSTGIADIQEQAYFTSAHPGKFTWAVGPIFSFPTATNNLLRTGQWGVGPTAVGLVMPGPWVIGMLMNNIWRIGGASNGHVLNSFTVQPFVNYNLPRAWAISTAPLITSNWSAVNGQKWTVPIGLGVSKITHVGEQPLNLLLQYYHAVEHPRFAGSEQLRIEAAALWPTAAAAAKEKEEREAREKAAKKKSQQ